MFDLYRAQEPEALWCSEPVSLILDDCPYQHENMTQCSKAKELRYKKGMCSTFIEKLMPFCKHSIWVKCGNSSVDKCHHQCMRIRKSTCGHICQGQCGDCIALTEEEFDINLRSSDEQIADWTAKMVHVPCKGKCGKILLCGHGCELDCHYQDGEYCDDWYVFDLNGANKSVSTT